MARAKRTDRAEARRRHRAATADPSADEMLDASTDGRSDVVEGVAGATKNATSGTPTRIGFMDAFRMSFRPVNVRKDIASVPWIATHTHALWIPVAVTVGIDDPDRCQRSD